jgi:hypothetical protein
MKAGLQISIKNLSMQNGSIKAPAKKPFCGLAAEWSCFTGRVFQLIRFCHLRSSRRFRFVFFHFPPFNAK